MVLATGISYRNRIRGDRREVWLAGERIADVTDDPFLGRCVDAIATLYDLQHELKGLAAIDLALDRNPVSVSHLAPRSVDALLRRGTAFRICADGSYGLLGRSPDYSNTVLSIISSSHEFFGRSEKAFGENLVAFQRDVAREDLFVSHCFATPQFDRRIAPSSESIGELRVVRETGSGVVVRGSRGLATQAPIADVLLSLGAGRALAQEEANLAVGFAVPIDTKGLRLFCRGSGVSYTDPLEWPLTSHFPEVDAITLFDDVEIPWERVFYYRDIEAANQFKRETRFFEHTAQHILTRSLVRADTIISVSHAMAEASGASSLEAVQSRLGEMIVMRECLASLLKVCVAEAQPSSSGVYFPSSNSARAGMCFNFRAQAKLRDHMDAIGSSGLVQTPVLDGLPPEVRDVLGSAYSSLSMEGDERLSLFRLAADITCSPTASRQRLFDRFSQGNPERALARLYQTADVLAWPTKIRECDGDTRWADL